MHNSNAIVRLEKSLAKRSLKALVRERASRSVLLVDISSSMNNATTSGVRKIDAMRRVVAEMRDQMPVPVIGFGGYGSGSRIDYLDDIPDGKGGTPMHRGIDFARTEGATHIVLVTDGIADSQSATMEAVRDFGGVIDTFYIGDPGEPGAEFMRAVARATGGVSNVDDLSKPKELASKIVGLLPAASGVL